MERADAREACGRFVRFEPKSAFLCPFFLFGPVVQSLLLRQRQLALDLEAPVQDLGAVVRLSAADIDGEAELARVVAHDLQADVVRLDDGAVVRRAVDGDFELARQEREFGMQRRPLADGGGRGGGLALRRRYP